jgi:ATP-binding cassette, subfamily A (ABC1), member 3
MVLYGITGALFAYCASLFMSSPLSAFAAVAGYQFIIYIVSRSCIPTQDTSTDGPSALPFRTPTCSHLRRNLDSVTDHQHHPLDNVPHRTRLQCRKPYLSPPNIYVSSPTWQARAAFVSVNLFQLLCDGRSVVNAASMGVITRYGGPILYLIVYAFILLAFLVWYDSGSRTARRVQDIKALFGSDEKRGSADGLADAEEASSTDDLLKVMGVSKTYDQKVVDDVSFSLPRDTVFALLGPNGAGKTTTFNMIRECHRFSHFILT